MLLEAVIFLLSGVVVVYVYFRYNRAGRLMAQLEGPPGIPLFGNMIDMYQSPEALFIKLRQWHKQYGNMYKLTGAHFRTIHLFKPEHIQIILSSTRYNYKGLPYTFLYSWLAKGLLVSNGEHWHERRKMLTPAFHFNILVKYFRTFQENALNLVDNLELEVGKEKTDVIPLISKTALRIMCETSLATKIREDTSAVTKYMKFVHDYGLISVYRLSRPWLFLDSLYVLTLSRIREKAIAKELHKFTNKIIGERREYRNKVEVCVTDDDDQVSGKKPKLAMLDLLLHEEKRGNIDNNGIQEEVDTLLFEGFDTTATALCFMIMRIANEPKIQNLIYEELQGIFGDTNRPILVEDLNKMKYLECCIKESLRLYPSVPFISRFVNEDIEIDGKVLPANSFYDIHAYDLHRNPEIYPDPEKFIPERFLPENMATRHPYAYIPFSAGPRNCIGQKFAIMELKTVMSSILRRYRLEPVTRCQDLVFMADLVLRTNHPIYVRFCDRNAVSS